MINTKQLLILIIINLQPVSSLKTILITPDTVKYYASFIHSSATINDLTLYFSSGSSRQEKMRVPIAAPGELTPQSLIRITVGMNPPATDNDPTVGITDGINRNQFQLIEDASLSTRHVNPCDVVNDHELQNGRSAPADNPVAAGYTLITVRSSTLIWKLYSE